MHINCSHALFDFVYSTICLPFKYYKYARKGYPPVWINCYITELLYRGLDEETVLSAPKAVLYVMILIVDHGDGLSELQQLELLNEEYEYLMAHYPPAVPALKSYFAARPVNFSIGPESEYIKHKIWEPILAYEAELDEPFSSDEISTDTEEDSSNSESE